MLGPQNTADRVGALCRCPSPPSPPLVVAEKNSAMSSNASTLGNSNAKGQRRFRSREEGKMRTCERESSGRRSSRDSSGEASTRSYRVAGVPFRKRGTSRFVRFWYQPRRNRLAPEITFSSQRKRAAELPSDGCPRSTSCCRVDFGSSGSFCSNTDLGITSRKYAIDFPLGSARQAG
jgi:hypothetical protein